MPIELDTEERRNNIIRACGAKPIGERPPSNGITRSLTYFTDPLTKSTLMLPLEEVSTENVQRKLFESRRKFSVAILETTLEGNLELIDQFKLFILSLERTKKLPDPIVTAAANAAVLEIVSYETAPITENFPSWPDDV
jgi:hypothetical protein